MNVTAIAGNVGKDSRLNSVQTNNGPMSVLNLSVAVQTSKKDQVTGKYISLWFDCALWGKRADSMVNYIKAVIDKLNEKRKRNYCDESQKSLAISRLKLGWKVDAIALETGLSNTTIRKIKRNMDTLDNRS